MVWQIKISAAVLAALLSLVLWQHARINSLKAELAGIETALVKAHADRVRSALEATNDVIIARDAAYAGAHEARTEAAKTIAALPRDKGDEAVGCPPRVVAVDAFLPLALSDALLMQQQGLRAGCGGDSPAGAVVCAEGSAEPARGSGAAHDPAPDGGMAKPVYRLGW